MSEIAKKIQFGELLELCLYRMGYNTMHTILEGFVSHKLANNYTAGFHAIFATAGNLINLCTEDNEWWSVLRTFSSAYFMYDLQYIFKHTKFTTMDIVYMYHHCATLYIMHQDPNIYNPSTLMFFSELSNIPSYFVYYFIKNNMTHKRGFTFLKNIQLWMFTLIRFPIMGYYLLKYYYKVENKLPLYPIIPVYIMGLVWAIKLFEQ